MADYTSGELDALPVPLDFGPVLKSATQGGSKRASKRAAARLANGNGRGGEPRDFGNTLTKKHFSVKHLYKCEQSHRWQWVPEKRLCSLWHSLSNEDRARVVQTHERDQLTRPFCEDLEAQMHQVECYASEGAKGTLASMIWCDQSGLALFKRIFIIAVEQNHPMVIDMEVIAAVDAVIQDFCASVVKMRQRRWLPWSLILSILLLVVFVFWLYDSSWTWLVCILAMGIALHSLCRSLPPLDPRSFGVGSDLWVQYREREHVRLMWMSATVRVFEVRLLRILERRRRVAKQAEAQQRHKNGVNALMNDTKVLGECSDGQAVRDGGAAAPKKKYLGQRRLMRQRRPGASSPSGSEETGKNHLPVAQGHSEQGSLGKVEEGSEFVEDVDAVVTETLMPHQSGGDAEEASSECGTAAEDLQTCGAESHASTEASSGAEFAGAEEAEEGEFDLDAGDEIDAEFARRVQEHFQNRVQAAGKDLHSQTDRGNQILKTLCEKLKTELERTSVPS